MPEKHAEFMDSLAADSIRQWHGGHGGGVVGGNASMSSTIGNISSIALPHTTALIPPVTSTAPSTTTPPTHSRTMQDDDPPPQELPTLVDPIEIAQQEGKPGRRPSRSQQHEQREKSSGSDSWGFTPPSLALPPLARPPTSSGSIPIGDTRYGVRSLGMSEEEEEWIFTASDAEGGGAAPSHGFAHFGLRLTYKDPLMNQVYSVRRSHGHYILTTGMLLLTALRFVGVMVYGMRHELSHVLNSLSIMFLVSVAFVNYYFAQAPLHRQRRIAKKTLEHWIPSLEMQLTWATTAERCGTALMLASIWPILEIYHGHPVCLSRVQSAPLNLTPEHAYHCCVQSIPAVYSLFTAFPVIFTNLQLAVVVPIQISMPFFFMASRFFLSHPEIVDTDKEFLLKTFFLTFITVVCIGTTYVVQQIGRRRFEVWVVLQRELRRYDKKKAIVEMTMRSLLSEAVVQKLMRNQPVLDISHNACITVCQVFDFAQWSGSVLPNVVVQTIDALFVTFDAGTSNFNLDKVRTVGDRYIVSQGLEAGGTGGFAILDTAPSVHFALWQVQVAQYLSSLLPGAFDVQVGCYTGASFGGIIGTQSLWYEVFGEAINGALTLAQMAEPGCCLVSESTRAQYNDAFLEEEEVSSGAGESTKAFIIQAVLREFVKPPNPARIPGQAEAMAADPMAGHTDFDSARRAFLGKCVTSQLSHHSFGHQVVDDVLSSRDEVAKVQGQFKQTEDNLLDMKFVPEHEPAYLRHVRVNNHADFLGTFNFQGFLIFILIVTIVEGSNTILSTLLLDASFLLQTYLLSQKNVGGNLLSLMSVTLLYAALASGHPSIITGNLIFVHGWSCFAVINQPSFSSLTLVTHCIYATVVQYIGNTIIHGEAQDNSVMSGVFITFARCACTAFSGEMSRRQHFREEVMGKVCSQATQATTMLQKTMLLMCVPEFAMSQVLAKTKSTAGFEGGGINPGGQRAVNPTIVLDSCGYMTVLTVEVVNFAKLLSSTPLSQVGSMMKEVQSMHDSIESAIARFGDQAGAQVRKIHAVGDTVVIGGPFTHRSRVNAQVTRGTTTVRRGPGLSDFNPHVATTTYPVRYDATTVAAHAVLDILWELRKVHGNRLSATLASGSAIMAVLGKERPTLDLLGPLTRTSMALQQAAPAGFIGMSSSFQQLLKDNHISLPRREQGDFTVGTPLRWRMRGSGVILVSPLYCDEHTSK